jgi:actin-like ATPase involved in cell morphogenesis
MTKNTTNTDKTQSSNPNTQSTQKIREAVLRCIESLPDDLMNNLAFLPPLKQALVLTLNMNNREEQLSIISELLQAVPPKGEYLSLYKQTLCAATELTNAIEAPPHRKSSLLRLSHSIPYKLELFSEYQAVMEQAINAADKIADLSIRRHSLVEITRKLEARGDFDELRLHTFRVALGLTGQAEYNTYSLDIIAKELPKSCDYEFYRSNTFFGIAAGMPKHGEFLSLYKEAIGVAIDAANTIELPYYRKYSLTFIANELGIDEEFAELHMRAILGAFQAANSIQETFSRQFALLEVLKDIPHSREYTPLIIDIVETMLPFFSVKSRLTDVDPLEVIDYLLVAEERKLSDAKKRKFARENYAQLLCTEIEDLTKELRDIRFIEVLKPYAHIWVRPLILRNTIKKSLIELKKLSTRYHGSEIERPLFISETHPSNTDDTLRADSAQRSYSGETIAIDLGATNTVIMRKKGENPPEPLWIEGVSRKCGDVSIIPTFINPETGRIDQEVTDKVCSINMKRMLLEGSSRGREYMTEYITALCERLKSPKDGELGWLSKKADAAADRICVTVPIGFDDYKDTIKEIFEEAETGYSIQVVEEPLAAAIGYQIAEKKDKLVLVIDFGGCTLDVMLLRMNTDEVHVVAKPDRSHMLGGHDIDLWLSEFITEKFGLKDNLESTELLCISEELKISLSEKSEVSFDLADTDNDTCTITRNDFEQMLAIKGFYKDIDRAITYILQRASKLAIDKGMIEAVLLTGGSSQIPSFKDKIGDTFRELRSANSIYDHSPFSAVAYGAAVYGTSDVTDKHLGMAYGLRFAKGGGKMHYSYEVILEKGDHIPFTKNFKLTPAKTLGTQKDIFLELVEIPEGLIDRRWISLSNDAEYIKQVLKRTEEVELKSLKIITLNFDESITNDVDVSFAVDKGGALTITYGSENKKVETNLRLQ